MFAVSNSINYELHSLARSDEPQWNRYVLICNFAVVIDGGAAVFMVFLLPFFSVTLPFRWARFFRTIKSIVVLWSIAWKFIPFSARFPMRTHVPLRFTMLYGTFLPLFACVQQTAVFTIKGKHTNKNNNTINYLNGLMKTSNFSIKLHTHTHFLLNKMAAIKWNESRITLP